MADYTCTLSYNGDAVIPQFQPERPGGIFRVEDKIEFISAGSDAVIRFNDGSPFEAGVQPKSYRIPLGARVPLMLQRACFASTAAAPGLAAAELALPTTDKRGQQKLYECRFTADGGKVVPVWSPEQALFYVGDWIRFANDTTSSLTLDFPLGAPFVTTTGAEKYMVGAGASLELEILRTCFVFSCSIPGVPPRGAGDPTPTGKRGS